MHQRLDIRWVAGFFDGEGCVGIYPNGAFRKLYLRVQIVQHTNNRWVLDNFSSEFGGGVYPMSTSRSVNWQINGEKAAAFLEKVLPHLRMKNKQVKLSLIFQREKKPPYRDKLGRMARLPNTKKELRLAKDVKALKERNT